MLSFKVAEDKRYGLFCQGCLEDGDKNADGNQIYALNYAITN